jgi:peptide/nickel transport system substrate-binding protein
MRNAHGDAPHLAVPDAARTTGSVRLGLRRLMALASIGILLAACAGQTPSGAAGSPGATGSTGDVAATTAPALDVLNFGYTTEPQTLDPYMGPGSNEFNIDVNVEDGLYTTNDKLEPVPNLAESATQVDPLTWEFHLRKGVTFSNGEPFNAASVVASYEHSMSTTLPIKNTWGADINLDRIEVIDDYTVRFHTTTPTPFLLSRIANDHYMQPPKWLATATDEDLARHPIGTGAYTLTEWVAGDHLTLQANPTYWGDPKPKIKTVIFKFLPDEATRVDNLRTGAVDLINYLSPASIPLLADQTDLEVKSVESGRRVYAGFNTKVAPFGDVRVRQAINYGTNIEQITKTILGSATSRLTNFAEPAFRDPTVTGYTYDPDKARQLLTDAGFPNGIDVTWDVDNRSYLGLDQFPEAVAASLADVGVRVTINKIDASVSTKNQKNRTTNGMYLRSNAAAFDPGLTFSILKPNHAGNATQWADPAFLALQDKLATGGTPAERLDWSYQAQHIVMDQAPMLFLWQEPSLFGVNKKVAGFVPSMDEKIRLNRLGS